MSDTFSNKEIKVLLEMLAKHDVTECQIERGGDKLTLKRGEKADAPVDGAQPSSIHQVFGSYPTAGYAPQAEAQIADAPRVVEAPVAVAPVAAASAAPAEPEAVTLTQQLDEIASPMVGTFYRKPTVDADPYVSVGDTVKKGQVLCIVEAMKLMNEIECESSGKIAEICLDDGQMVEFGEVLFRIEPA